VPNYVYILRNENNEIIDSIEEMRSVKEREKSIFKNNSEYKFEPGYLNAPTNFVLAGPGWTSNNIIRYEDKDEFNKRINDEAKRKDFVQKHNETSGFENDANYSDRIKQGMKNIREGKLPDGTIDPLSPNVSVGTHEKL